MHTIIDLIKKTEDFFISKNIENPRYQAEVILADSLNLERIHLYAQFDRILTNDELIICREKLKNYSSNKQIVTIEEIVNKCITNLEKNKIENAKHDASELVSYILDIPRLELVLNHKETISDHQRQLIEKLIERRMNREPLQYILGFVEFYGLKLLVNKNVLIPRQETEYLVEIILNDLKKNENIQILDIGTGTGCISLALKNNLINSNISSIDKFPEALNLASKNMERNGLDINLINMDFLDEEHWINLVGYDVIVSNPPYVTINEYHSLKPELTNFEPKNALTDNDDGLTFYKKICQFSKTHLKANGKLYLEHGDKQQKEIVQLLKNTSYFNNIQCYKDLNGFDRFIVAIKNNE